MKTAFIIGYDNLGAVSALSECVRDNNFNKTVVLCNDPNLLDDILINSDNAPEVHCLNVCSSQSLIEFFNVYGFDVTNDVFLCMQDRPMLAYLDCIEHLNSKHNYNSPIPIEGIRNARIKPMARRCLDIAKLNNAAWMVCDKASLKNAQLFFSARKVKEVYIKPVAGMGSELVTKSLVEDLTTNLRTCFDKLDIHYMEQNVQHNSGNGEHSLNHSLIVEQCLYGPEYTVDGFIMNGEITAIAQHKETRKIRPFIGDGLIVSPPSSIGGRPTETIPDRPGYEMSSPAMSNEDNLISYCKDVLDALEIDNWVFHIELIDAINIGDNLQNGPCIVEINPRPPGGLLARSFFHRKGENLVDIAVDMHLRKPIEISNNKCVTGQFPVYWEKGVLENVTNIDGTKNIKNVEFIQICTRLSSYSEEQENYLAFVMLKAPTHYDVRMAAKIAFQTLTGL